MSTGPIISLPLMGFLYFDTCPRVIAPPRAAPRGAMALAALSGDEQCVIFSQLCNVLDTRIAVAFSSKH